MDPIELALDVTVWSVSVTAAIGLATLLYRMLGRMILNVCGDAKARHAHLLDSVTELEERVDHLHKSATLLATQVAVLDERTKKKGLLL